MDFLTFLATVIGSLAWPVSLMVAVFMLRLPIAELLPGLRRLKYKDFDLYDSKFRFMLGNLPYGADHVCIQITQQRKQHE